MRAKRDQENVDKELVKHGFSVMVRGEGIAATWGIRYGLEDIIYTKCLDHKNPEIPKLIIRAIDDYREKAIEALFEHYWSVPYQLDNSSSEI